MNKKKVILITGANSGRKNDQAHDILRNNFGDRAFDKALKTMVS